MVERFTVAIDGPAAAGKGTISKAVAAHFGLAHLDTGLLYRAVGAKVLAGEDAIEAAQAFSILDMAGDNLRSAEVAAADADAVAVVSAAERIRDAGVWEETKERRCFGVRSRARRTFDVLLDWLSRIAFWP